ncbi:MAG TPA: AraC family transcriptional regulator [Gemmatimonadaceae bacterium]
MTASRVERARRFIEDNASRRLTVREVAQSVGANPFELVRAFSAIHGVAPYGYSLRCRVSRAKGLLAAGERPSMVALSCGFFDQSHLNRQFKRIYGITPGAFVSSLKELSA